LTTTEGKGDSIYFVDAAHPQHNLVIACGWIKRGEEHAVRTNRGPQRVNINGASDVSTGLDELLLGKRVVPI